MAEREAKRLCQWRTFASGEAIDRTSNYYVDWKDMEELVDDIASNKWLLITGPFQSGKTSLAYALAARLRDEDYFPVLSTVTLEMVAAANSKLMAEEEASREFFRLLARDVERDSEGVLKWQSDVTEMFWGVGKRLVWFLDEASLLNEIERPNILHSLLSGLRSCKQANKRPTGASSLCSFVLIGTPRTRRLVEAIRNGDGLYTSPNPAHDPLQPLKDSRLVSPLNLERLRKADSFSVDDILSLLTAYASERRIPFLQAPGNEPSADEQNLALQGFANSIYELTSGYKGMVGCCCDYICQKGIRVHTEWQKKVRRGNVSHRVFSSTVFSRIVSSVCEYPPALQQLVLRCILSGDSSEGRPADVDPLPAVDNGVLTWDCNKTLTLTSSLLLSALLEDCMQLYNDRLPKVGTFDEAVRAAFTFMKHERLVTDGVLNANKQPSEYIWQSEFFLALKFVLENAYREHNFRILVEAKKRDENGHRRTRLDFLVKSQRQTVGIQVQGKATDASIAEHISRCGYDRDLHECEMHYVYFVMGSDGCSAMPVISRQRETLKGKLQCWIVGYVPEGRKWNIHKLLEDRSWESHQQDAPSSYPSFMF